VIALKLTGMIEKRVIEHWSCRGKNASQQETQDEIVREDRNVTGSCHYCGTWLVFQIGRAGEMVNCPHCFMGTILHAPDQRFSPTLSETDFQFRKLTWGVTSSGHRSVIGELLNCSKLSFDWVRIQFTLFNSVDVPIGITSDFLIGFRSGAAWKFNAPVFENVLARCSMPILSTEYGPLRAPKRSKAAQPDPLQDLTDSEHSSDRGVYPSYTDSLMGKARTAGRHQVLVKPHWSQLGSLT
jgi:hypothetical protein